MDYPLLLTFVFSIFELLYFIPAVMSLYEGFSFAALWYQGEAVYAKKVKKKKTKSKEERNNENKTRILDST